MFETDGIQRVTILYRPENLVPAMREFNDVLGVTFEGPHTLSELGVRIAASWAQGIELLAPLETGTHSAELKHLLCTRGEGVCALAYGVQDLRSAELRARMYGRPRTGECIDLRRAHSAWWDRYSMNFALPVAAIAGVPITLVHVQERLDCQPYPIAGHDPAHALRSVGTPQGVIEM